MNDSSFQFASDLAIDLTTNSQLFHTQADSPAKVQAIHGENSSTILDLTPFKTMAQPATAKKYFENINSSQELIDAYHSVRNNYPFETDLIGVKKEISEYANQFVINIINSAHKLSEIQIQLISKFVKNLDVYCAIKSIESLLNSEADLALLEVAEKNNWHVHFDHLAIRCGSQKHNNAATIANYLIKDHGYLPSQVKSEAHYQFPDGWNAFPLYKMLDNGQALRLFVDQSDLTNNTQIIQHWNQVYGYTAHHLALRTTKIENNETQEIPLDVVMNALQDHGITILTPTGEHTHGFLLQVFTKPELNESVPASMLNRLRELDPKLEKTIKNGKLLEVVSRKEMPKAMAKRLFELYDLSYDANDPLHSAPYYTYFLPAQAAHVIKTSQTISQ